MNSKSTGWTHLAREAFLILAFAYIILLAGGFAGLVNFRIQAISTLFAVLVLGSWLIFRALKKEGIQRSGVDWAILLFLAVQFIAVIFSEDPRRSLDHTILWLVYVLIFYFTLDLLRKGWSQDLLFRCLLLVGAVLLVFSAVDLAQLYMQWKQLSAGLEFIPSFQQRVSTIVGDPNLLAAILNLLFPVALATLSLARNKIVKTGIAIYLVLSIVVLYFTDSRGGLLGSAASVGVFTFLWIFLVSEQAKKRVKAWAMWLWQHKLLLLAGIVLLAAALGFVAWRFISFQGSTTHAPALEARDIYWQAATNAVKADPLTGAGPGMYPIYLMEIWSTPPARPYLHAHSFPFQVAAESGLLGLAAATILIIVITRQAWNIWNPLDFQARVRWAAAVAAVLGLAAHSLVDDFFPFPAVGVLVFVFLALILSPKPEKKNEARLNPWVFAIPALATAAFSVYSLNAYYHVDKAVDLGSRGNWGLAAAEMEMAAKSDPWMAFYWLQTGYAYGRAAESNPEVIGNAVTAYQKGIEREPEYALNRANFASLLWASGSQQEALPQMRIATSLAPQASLLLINEGAYYEALGLKDEAASSYSLAINFQPQIINSRFWDLSELRINATRIATETTIFDDPRKQAAALINAAKLKIANSEFDAALSLLEQAHALDDQKVSLYTELGELAYSQGDLEKAEHYVQMALWIQTTTNQEKVDAILLGAEISLTKGDREEALRRYEIAYKAIFAETSYGWGSSGWSPYAWFVFQRQAFSEDLLPQLERADILKDIAQLLLPLVDLYEENGESERAQEVSKALQPYLP